ncbi:hypothetical protein HDV01_005659 [Terramyces sp. JEL0728]|nr:hypothetical protein HDV01_005659 [Terramyces sp. JEL0728]
MLERVTLQLKVHLAPKFISNTKAGIKDYLDALLQKDAVIKTESPYMHFDVQVDFTVFSPKVQDLMIGVVNKVSPDHVGCLVYGLFNASIARESLPEWTWDYEENVWTAGDVIVQPGSVVKFKAERFETCNDILSIHGSMVRDGTGIVDMTGIPTPPMAILPTVPADVDEREGIVDPYADDTDYEKTPIRKKIVFKDEDEMEVDTQPTEKLATQGEGEADAQDEDQVPASQPDKAEKKSSPTLEKSKEKSSEKKKTKKRKFEEQDKETKKKKK